MAQTTKKLRENPKKRRGKAKKKGRDTENDELRSRIKEIIAQKFWRAIKFVPPGDDQETKLFNMVRVAMIKEGTISPPYRASKRQEEAWEKGWLEENGAIIASEFNSHRNYVQSVMKGAARKYWEDNNETLPSVDKILACARRTIDVNDPEDVRIFTWYWDCLLPQVTGNNRDWQPGIRHYATISEAAPQDTPAKLYMTASHEAFAATHYNSYRDSWLEQWQLKKANPGKSIIPAKIRPPGVDDSVEFLVGATSIRCYAAKYKAKWTSSDTGAERTGGWSKEGKKAYQDLLVEVKKARSVAQNRQKEQILLDSLRKNLGLTATSYEEERRKKRRKSNANSLVDDHDGDCFDAELAELEPASDEGDVEEDGADGQGNGEVGAPDADDDDQDEDEESENN